MRIVGEAVGNGELHDAIFGDITDHEDETLESVGDEVSNIDGLAGKGGSLSRVGDINGRNEDG